MTTIHLLEDIGVQNVLDGQELDKHEESSKRPRDDGINEASGKGHRAYGRGAESADDNELPGFVTGFRAHQLVQLLRCIGNRDLIVYNLWFSDKHFHIAFGNLQRKRTFQ